jgi:sucrose synthase
VIRTVHDLLDLHPRSLSHVFQRLIDLGQPFVKWPELNLEYERCIEAAEVEGLEADELAELMAHTQEVVVDAPVLYLAIRARVAEWHYLRVDTEEMLAMTVPPSEFLAAKERLVLGTDRERYVLEIDLAPFERDFPKPSRAEWIGRGVEYLNRLLSSRLFHDDGTGVRRLFDFLRVHQVEGRQLMLNGTIRDPEELRMGLRRAVRYLRKTIAEEGAGSDWLGALAEIGFEPGWGGTPERARESMELLLDVLDAPSPRQLEDFLGRIPMITSIAILSPHGYFGQSNVLGKPDTGGQVVYILDQVRALEKEMRRSLLEQGIDIDPQIVVLSRLIPEAGNTTCDLRVEPIEGTQNARILRVPFRDHHGEVVRPWISRFDIWPYLERYAIDAERELLEELGGRPDFVIGNYSDGNLVASIMAHRLGVTQCNIAHALEKTKYENSDLRWREFEEDHHFSCQHTADLIAMNTAHFIITSTYQEIAGGSDSIGQYESYQAYTMPGLYRVVSGIDCYDPKFNIVSPGANPEVFFPYWEEERRGAAASEDVRDLVFGKPDDAFRGTFADPDKPLLFAMSRLDRIKNTTGLLEMYAGSDRLREQANLLLVGGWLDPALSSDADERQQIERTHAILDQNGLDGSVRWVEMQTDKYRVVADCRGAFVQPALFEAFGLTVIEAMSSGLPVFATRYGGPVEIIEHGDSGFNIDPVLPAASAGIITSFFDRCADDPEAWDRVSRKAVERTRERYNWPLYASTLLKLSRIYGFWKYITSLERHETTRYLEMLYALQYRPLARRLERSE